MITAILVLLSVAVALLGACLVVLVRGLWPREMTGCAFLGRNCTKRACRFWSKQHGACTINLAFRCYLDRDGGNAKWLVNEMKKAAESTG